jgi:endonuclease G, mitochondrial
MRRTMFALFVALVSLGTSPAFADFVEVKRNANLYAEPDSNSEALKHYVPPTGAGAEPIRLLVTGAKQNGYFPVSSSAGLQGFIHGTRVTKFPGALPGASAEIAATLPGGFPLDAGTGDQILRVTNIGYTAGYSETKQNPLWVAHRIGTHRPHQCARLSRFRTDARTESRITHNDYNGSGYDRGHMAPSATIGHEFGCDAQDETYFMTNIIPQLPGVNQKAWGGFENVVEDVYATNFRGVWVITGPIFDPNTIFGICSGVEIPPSFYKIVLRNDGGNLDALAIIMKQDTAPGTPIKNLRSSVDEIERLTGLDFFAGLADGTEAALESQVAADVDWKLDTALDTTFDGTPRTKCENAPVTRTPVDG